MPNRQHIVLLGCTATKHRQSMSAENLYAASPLFRKRLAWAKRLQPDCIRILSARYGVVEPTKQIEPYDQTVARMTVSERLAWGEDVCASLADIADLENDNFTVLAGAAYMRPLAPYLPHLHAPLRGLPIGRQLQALDLLNAWNPNAACAFIHRLCRSLATHPVPPPEGAIPSNGIYLLFEKGETGHDGSRIVRIGTHRGDGQLPGRVSEHFSVENRHRSIFRKHIGRALLNARGEYDLLAQWDIDLTTRASREQHESGLNHAELQAVEEEVTRHMCERFRVAFLPVVDRERRLALEAALVATINGCCGCGSSDEWLGQHSTKPQIGRSGLWQVQQLESMPMTAMEYDELVFAVMGADPKDRPTREEGPIGVARKYKSTARPGRGHGRRYTPLADYLKGSRRTSLTLTFPEIEGILGRPLPASAYRHRPWWANGRGATAHTQAQAWLRSGYRVAEVDLNASPPRVRFESVTP